MGVAAVVASVVLGAVFLVAGASKLVAGDDWLEQAKGLGAPRWLAPVVPWLELVLGALLVTQVQRTIVASVAAVVLIALTGLLVVRLSEGERPPCACFGRWSSRPIGAGHVVRNVLLVLVAAVAALL